MTTKTLDPSSACDVSSPKQEAEGVADDDAGGVGGQVFPFPVSGGGGVLLQEFQCGAHDDGHERRPEQEAAVVGTEVPTTVLPVDDETRTAIHDKVGPLVDERNVVEGCIGKEGNEREHPYQHDAEDG